MLREPSTQMRGRRDADESVPIVVFLSFLFWPGLVWFDMDVPPSVAGLLNMDVLESEVTFRFATKVYLLYLLSA